MVLHRPSVPIHDSLDTPSQLADPRHHDHSHFSRDCDRVPALSVGYALLIASQAKTRDSHSTSLL